MRAGRPRRGELSVLKKIGITKRLSFQAQAFASMPAFLRDDVIERRRSLTDAIAIYRLALRLATEDGTAWYQAADDPGARASLAAGDLMREAEGLPR